MTDQPRSESQPPTTPEGDYRKAADVLRTLLAEFESDSTDRYDIARDLGDMAIRMIAAQNGAGLAAVAPPPKEPPEE